MPLEDLANLIGQMSRGTGLGCIERPESAHWAAVEYPKQFGLIFPDDYKGLISAIGTAMLPGGFCLFNPAASNLKFALSYRNIAGMYRQHMLHLSPFGIPVFPETGGMIPIATAPAKLRLAFMPGRNGRLETVLIDLKNGALESHGHDFLSFLSQFLMGPRTSELTGRLARKCKFDAGRDVEWMDVDKV